MKHKSVAQKSEMVCPFNSLKNILKYVLWNAPKFAYDRVDEIRLEFHAK